MVSEELKINNILSLFVGNIFDHINWTSTVSEFFFFFHGRHSSVLQSADLVSQRLGNPPQSRSRGAEAGPSAQGRGSHFGVWSFDLAPGH